MANGVCAFHAKSIDILSRIKEKTCDQLSDHKIHNGDLQRPSYGMHTGKIPLYFIGFLGVYLNTL